MLLDPPYKKWIIDSFLSGTMYHLENCLPISIDYVLHTFLVSNGKYCTCAPTSNLAIIRTYTCIPSLLINQLSWKTCKRLIEFDIISWRPRESEITLHHFPLPPSFFGLLISEQPPPPDYCHFVGFQSSVGTSWAGSYFPTKMVKPKLEQKLTNVKYPDYPGYRLPVKQSMIEEFC